MCLLNKSLANPKSRLSPHALRLACCVTRGGTARAYGAARRGRCIARHGAWANDPQIKCGARRNERIANFCGICQKNLYFPDQEGRAKRLEGLRSSARSPY